MLNMFDTIDMWLSVPVVFGVDRFVLGTLIIALLCCLTHIIREK